MIGHARHTAQEARGAAAAGFLTPANVVLFVATVVLALASAPRWAGAAEITPSGAIHTAGGSTFGYEFADDGETNFSVRLNDPLPVRVDLSPSASAGHEFFNVRLSTLGLTTLNDLTVRWDKQGGLSTHSAPSAVDWAHFGLLVFTDRGMVDTAAVSAGDTFYEVLLTFSDIYANFVQFDFLWVGFNDPRAEFSMTFDANGANLLTPIPGAAWLFGSAVLGLLGFGRRSAPGS